MKNILLSGMLLLLISFTAYGNDKDLNDIYKNIKYSYRIADDAKALTLSREAVEIAENTYGKNNIKTTKALIYLAKSLWIVKKLEEAITVQSRILSIREKHYGVGNENTISALMKLGDLYYENKDDLKAKHAYEKLLKIETRLLGEDSYEVALDKFYLARVYASMKDNKKAISLAKESLQGLEWLVKNEQRLPKYVKPYNVQLDIVKVATMLAKIDTKNTEYYKKKYGTVTYLR